MVKKIFVGGLAWATDDESLKQGFEHCGEVIDAKVIKDQESGRSRGFGFVSFSDDVAVNKAIQNMDGKDLDGRPVRVSEARQRAAR